MCVSWEAASCGDMCLRWGSWKHTACLTNTPDTEWEHSPVGTWSESRQWITHRWPFSQPCGQETVSWSKCLNNGRAPQWSKDTQTNKGNEITRIGRLFQLSNQKRLCLSPLTIWRLSRDEAISLANTISSEKAQLGRTPVQYRSVLLNYSSSSFYQERRALKLLCS